MEKDGSSSWLLLIQAIIGLATIGASLLGAWWVNKNKKTEISQTTTVAEKNILLEGNDELIKNLSVTVSRVENKNKELDQEIKHMKARETIFYTHMYVMDRWANKAYDKLDGKIDVPPQWPKELL